MQHLNLTRIAVPDLPQENTVGIMADVTPPMGLTRFAAAVSGGDPIKTGVIHDQALQAILATQVALWSWLRTRPIRYASFWPISVPTGSCADHLHQFWL